MISVSIYKNKKGMYIGARAFGHAERRPIGEEDALCAAVSVLMLNTFNSLESLTNSKLDYKLEDGFLDFKIESVLNKETELLMKSLELGIESIIDPQYIRLEIKEV